MRHAPPTDPCDAEVGADCAQRAPHPLGPVLVRHRATQRCTALIVALVAAAVLALAGWLQPDPSGMGTHAQLGFPPCTWPSAWGIPCPTCGMTTSFALTVRGRWLAAFLAQPVGFLAAVGTIAIVVLAGREAVTGRGWRVNWYRVPPGRVVIAVVILVLAAWGYKLLVFRAQMG